MIHLYASKAHYAQHLWPIWSALPVELRGESWSPRSACWWGSPLPHPRTRPDGLVMVAAFADARKMTPRHRLVYVEHGAGQTYDGDEAARGNGSYSGGDGLDAVDLFIAPGHHVERRWRQRYDRPVSVAGCPKLDDWHAGRRGRRPTTARPLVAVTFHWECTLVPETLSARPHYEKALSSLRDAVRACGGELLGHGHPRAWGSLRALWSSLGVPHTPHLADVLDQADMLVGDNTSALFEFASLDRPVVVLNAPWYRRDVDHGLRFWSHVPGVEVDEPDLLTDTVINALTGDTPATTRLRRRAVDHVYAHRDGRAAERAAAAIVEVCGSEQPEGATAIAGGVAD